MQTPARQKHPRRHRLRFAVAGLAALGAALAPAAAAAEPTPSPGATPINRAGTSFFTATAVNAGQPVQVSGFTGDYLYWAISSDAGQITEIAMTVTLPPADKRSGPSTWTVDVFDGLRRRQACTAGAQTPTATAEAAEVVLGCTLRRVRSWAEPWSGDPLPGTYYIRLSVIDLPEPDIGLPIQVDMLISSTDGGSSADDGQLKAPLVPAAKPGRIMTKAEEPVDPSPSPSPVAADSGWFSWVSWDWLPDLSARWIWTTVGGALAAVAGVVGFSLTWRRRS